ncbi:MAG TPA: dihydropyrimidine dehydrogenase, partial [Candidatus Atribacteria bacterium]|nr:dihydropyrimidine dehydrogenase [Candidatus Atribacteria bacterium]
MAQMIPVKERMKREQVPMPEQDPQERIHNFREVPLGYSKDQAIYEAQRCLQCKVPKCRQGCPAEINIPQFIQKIVEEDFKGAYLEILKTDNLTAITGRVCPQEEQCQKYCILEKQKKPIAIGRLERFVADWARENDLHGELSSLTPKEQKIAIV